MQTITIQKNKLPEGWEVKRLGNLLKLQGGFAFKSEKFQKEGIPIIRISNLDDEKLNLGEDVVYYPKERLDEFKDFVLEEGDILIAMSGATTGKIGRVFKKNLPCLLNQRVGKFKIFDKKELDLKFLFYFVKSPRFQKEIWDYVLGCAQSNISGKHIEKIEILLPPLQTQQKIVQKLDAFFGSYNKLKQEKQKAKEKYERIFQSAIASLIPRDELLKGWEEKELKEVTEIIMGQSPPSKTYNSDSKGLPFFQGKAEFGER